MFFTSSVNLIILEEVIEEMFFVLWCSLQYLRIILFIKHQKDAKFRSKAIDLKTFHLDSIKEEEEKYSPEVDIELQDVGSRTRDSRKVRMSYDDGDINYA